MVDRSKPPSLQPIETLDLPTPDEHKLSNGIPVYRIEAGKEPMTQLTFLFEAGRWQQEQPLTAVLVKEMLTRGTASYSAREIAHTLDYYGAFLRSEVKHDFVKFTLYVPNQYLASVLPVLRSMFREATFPQRELEIVRNEKRQRLLMKLERTSYLARCKFDEVLFGPDHPYGFAPQPEDYDNIERDHLIGFYRKHYHPGRCQIIAAGLLPENLLKKVDHYLGDAPDHTITEGASQHPDKPSSQEEHFVELPEAVQSSLQVGRRTITKTHADYPGLKVLTTLLGGYFGSRLMTNIREEKGYTYGIRASLQSYQQSGMFEIETDVGSQYTEATLKEIFREIERLQQEPVPEKELETVRNYMQGTLLTQIDGPFALAQVFQQVLLFGLSMDFFQHYLQVIQTITPGQLRDLAQKYWGRNKLYTVIVGNKEANVVN